MRRLRLIHFIVLAILSIILAAGPAWGQQTPGTTAQGKDYKVFKIKAGQLDKKNFTEVPSGNPIIVELEKAAGGRPGADDVIFVHMPNPGTCVYYRGTWYC